MAHGVVRGQAGVLAMDRGMAVGAQPLLSPGEDLVDEPQC